MSSSRVDVECDAKETELQRPAEKVRNWKVFPGKNTFFCDGRCICAPHWYGFPCCLIIHIVMGKLIVQALFAGNKLLIGSIALKTGRSVQET